MTYSSETSDEPTIKEENISDFLPSKVIHENIQEENEIDSISPAGELIRWHHRLGHLSFVKMRVLIMLRIPPKELLTVKTQMCASCKAEEMTKKLTRVKGSEKNNKLKEVCSPGECISVDELESRTPGFIGVLKGFLTKKRYTYAAIFVDHCNGYTYIHLQISTNSEVMVKEKEAFEAIYSAMGVHVHYYHADNGRFCKKELTKAVKYNEQTISLYGVSAHLQNGKVQREYWASKIRHEKYCCMPPRDIYKL